MCAHRPTKVHGCIVRCKWFGQKGIITVMANAMQVECNLATQYGNVNKIFNNKYMPIETLLSGAVTSTSI